MIREYRCACGEVQERIESSDCTAEGPKCKACGRVTEKVEISVGSFRLYGNGFYKPNER